MTSSPMPILPPEYDPAVAASEETPVTAPATPWPGPGASPHLVDAPPPGYRPGWYPTGWGWIGWWDGARWTEHKHSTPPNLPDSIDNGYSTNPTMSWVWAAIQACVLVPFWIALAMIQPLALLLVALNLYTAFRFAVRGWRGHQRTRRERMLREWYRAPNPNWRHSLSSGLHT